MKMKKLIIGSVMAVAVACTACAFAACGGEDDVVPTPDPSSTTATVVAEGTGYGEWGQGCYVLYQEYSDGSVIITGAWTDYDYASGGPSDTFVMLQEFKGSVEKGVDEDGDPCVVLTIDTYEYLNMDHTALSGDYAAAGMGGTTTYEYDPFRTNDYNTTTGVYTIGFAINESGYYKIEYSITVSPVSTGTDVDAWISSTESTLTKSSGSTGDDNSVNLDEMEFTVDETGNATLTDGWMKLELKSDNTFTCTNLLSSIGGTDTVTASGSWSISENIITLTVTGDDSTTSTITATEVEAADGTTAYGLTLPGTYGDSTLYYTATNVASLSSDAEV